MHAQSIERDRPRVVARCYRGAASNANNQARDDVPTITDLLSSSQSNAWNTGPNPVVGFQRIDHRREEYHLWENPEDGWEENRHEEAH